MNVLEMLADINFWLKQPDVNQATQIKVRRDRGQPDDLVDIHSILVFSYSEDTKSFIIDI